MSDLRNRAAAAAGNAVERAADTPPPTIGALIQSMVPEIQRALPRHMDADRMARIALTNIRKTPDLAKCTPESFMGALLTCAQLGLEPGPTGEAYLVPYKDTKARRVECQLIIGYQGYAKLFWQHPLAKHLDAQVVYAADDFDYAYGLEPFLRHKPAIGNRGEIVAYYAVAALTSGATAFVVLSPEDCKKLRGKEGPNGGIKDPMKWMERKTAVRQLVKLLPKSPEMVRALAQDETVRTDLSEPAIDAPGPILGYVVDESTGEIEPGPAPDDTFADDDAGQQEWPPVAQPGGAA